MLVRMTSALIALTFIASPLWATAFNLSGDWEAGAMGAKLKAHVEQNGNQINGVAHVYPLFGKKLTYHFSGKVNGSEIYAAHHQGHSFRGRLNSRGLIEGVVRTKQGHKVGITAHRR